MSDWRHRAACKDVDSELFFPIGHGAPAEAQAERAKAVCGRCPVKSDCLAWALETKQEFGVWGGLSEEERRAILRKANPGPVVVHQPAKRLAVETKPCAHCRVLITGPVVRLYCSLRCSRASRKAQAKARREAMAAEIAEVLG